ncbi:MAG: AAA family ATPase [Gammaproteobacteria bacterium]|nr:hypothetical protein [Gammaproteobacteria bacterium]
MTRLTLQLLGPLRVLDEHGAELKISSRKSRALLAYMALRPGESQGRQKLAALLWEEADDELARTSLRQAVATLRKALPKSCQHALVTTSDSIALDPQLIESDLMRLRRALAAATCASLQEAVELLRGELLDGLDARSSAFDEWLTHERMSIRRQAIEALQSLTQLCIANEDVEGAIRACAKHLALEPLNEAAHRAMMELHARRGAYAEALRQYRVCRDALRRELDIAPEPATEQLFRELMRRRRAGAALAEAAAAGDNPSEVPATPARAEQRPQLRDAVVWVARLGGLLELEATLDPEDAQALASAFQERVERIAKDFGGTVDRRVGCNVLTVFGIPNARGNEPERSVRAALALRQSLLHEPLPTPRPLSLQIGIAVGQVLPAPTIFPLSGRPTHIAHVLASCARNGEILVSDELRQALGDRVNCRRIAERDITGADTAAWSLECIRSLREGPLPFVGRRPELAMVLAALERCRSGGRGRSIIVRGEPGIGKSRLVEAVMSAARERGVEVHSAQIFDFGQSPGRGPITCIALGLMGSDPDVSGAERAAAVRRMLAARGSSIDQAIFLSELVDAPLEPELAALEEAMDPSTRQRGHTMALAQLIEWAAQRAPLLLVVEDIHWADDHERARLAEIAAVVASCPILFIMTTRPEGDPINATWRARARGCPVTTLDLAPLAADEAEEFAAFYPELPRETIKACIRRAEGYPLFLDQLLRAANAGSTSLPGSVRTLVLARADGLPDIDHRALQAGAVLGQQSQLDALREMIGHSDYEPTLLIEHGFMRAEGIQLQFAHALFRDAIYESILKSHRRELHRSAARWFAQRDLALYAEHLAAAQEGSAASAYLDAAHAEQQTLRFERALGLAQKGLALAREPTLLHSLSALLGELLLQLGRTHDALAAFRESLDFAVDPLSRGQAWYGIASALRVMDRHEEALDCLERAEAQWHERADARMRARLYTLRGNLLFPLGRIEACLKAHEEAYRYALEARSALEIACALGGLGDAYYQRGQMITARRHFAQCVQEARGENLVGVLLANLPMLAITEIYFGAPSAGREHLQEALDLATRIGDLRNELLIYVCYCEGFLIQGQYGEARSRALHALELARQLGARRFQAECMGMLAGAMLGASERDEALRVARESVHISRECGMSYCGPVLLSLVARATDDPAERIRALEEGESLLAAGCVSHSYFNFYMHAIEVSLEQGHWNEARRYASALETYTWPEPLPFTTMLVERARVLADLGEGLQSDDTYTALKALHAECLRMQAHSALTGIERFVDCS